MPSKFSLCLTMLLLVLQMGCATANIGRPRVDIAFVNHSSADLEAVCARFGQYECGVGHLGRTFLAGYGNFRHPITNDVEVRWEVNRTLKVERLDLRKVYPPGRAGRLTFTITDKGVSAGFAVEPAPQ
ncbi:MAG: hypothetical protein RLZZ265_3578 [Verrucomicrobiota bacterium]|jgi:hypothetical protein